MTTPATLTADEIDELERQHTAESPVPCVVCGGEMVPFYIRGRTTVWHCRSAMGDFESDGRKHKRDSAQELRNGDTAVLRLIAAARLGLAAQQHGTLVELEKVDAIVRRVIMAWSASSDEHLADTLQDLLTWRSDRALAAAERATDSTS